jgi:phage-related protein
VALANTIEVTVNADTAAAVAQVVAASKAMEKSLGSIDAKIRFPDADKDADRAGADSGRAYWRGFDRESDKGSKRSGGRLKRAVALWGGLFIALGETAGVALYGATGAVGSLASSLLSAVGAGAALLPVAAGLAAAFATIAIGVSGVGGGFKAINKEFADAVKEGRAFNIEADGIKEALKGMAPEAARLVTAFGEIRGELSQFKLAIQGDLFAGLTEAFQDIYTKQKDSVVEAFRTIATVINGVIKDVVAAIGEFDIGQILSSWAPIIGNVLGALAPLTTAFLNFLTTATPFAEVLSRRFAEWAENLAGLTEGEAGRERMVDFLERSVASMDAWLGLIGAVGGAFNTFIKIASGEGDSLVTSLTKIVTKFDEWMQTAGGESAVREFLETSTRLLKSMTPILDGIVGMFDKVVTAEAVGRFEDLAKTLGDLLPYIGELLHAVGDTGLLNTFAEAILEIARAAERSGLIDAIQRLATAIGTSLGKVLDKLVSSGVLDVLGEGLALIAEAAAEVLTAIFSNQEFLDAFREGLAAIADVVAILVPLFVELLPSLLNLLPAFISLLELLPPLAELIAALTPVLTLVIDAFVLWSTVSAEVMGAIAAVVSTVITEIIEFITALVESFTPLVESVRSLPEIWNAALAAVTGAISAFVGFVTGAFRAVRDVVVDVWNGMWAAVKSLYKTFFSGFVSDIGGYFRGLISTLQGVWDSITSAFSGFISFMTGLWDDAKSAWNDTVADLRQFKTDVINTIKAIPDAVTGALSKLVDAIVNPFKKAYETAKGWVDKIKNLPGSIAGGIGGALGSLNPFARGGMVFGPTKALIGEAGPEAVIPLGRPLHQIDPSVRKMAELLRNGPTTAGGNQSNTVQRIAPQTNNFVIHDSTGSAEATAQKIVNRLLVGL